MDAYATQQLKQALNTEVIRRMLIKYFLSRGFTESFDRLMYPATIQDLQFTIPELITKLEVIPHALLIDPMTDSAKIGWNLFILGGQRMYLGETYHSGLSQLAQMLMSGQVISEHSNATHQTTPRRVIHFITTTLRRVEAGYVDLTPKIMPAMVNMFGNRVSNNMGMANQFFSRSGYGT